MKKILLFFILLVNISVLYSQNTVPIGKYEVYFIGWLAGDNNHHCGNAYVEMTLSGDNGDEVSKIFNAEYWEDSPRQNFNKSNTLSTFDANKRIKKLFFLSTRYQNSSCRGTRRNNNGYLENGLNVPCYSLFFKFDGSAGFTNSYEENGVGLWNSEFTIYIQPKLVIINNNPAGNFLPTEDKITIDSHAGFKAAEYNWRYSLDGYTWNTLPQYNGQSSIQVNAGDLFGDDRNSYIGRNVYFKQVACDNNCESDPVMYTISQNAPHITSHTTAPTKCYDTTDGSLTLSFDRALLDDETLGASLVNTTTGAAVSNENLTDALKSSTSVTIENLSPGNYRLDLLGTYQGNATYTGGLQHTTTFEITRPTQVDFSFVSKTNVFCHGGSDGIINITATGGQNSYKYTVTGDNGVTIDWMSFDSGYNAAIKNLTAGTYRIEVQDTNDCPAKESGNIKVVTVQITQPAAPIALSETDIKSPTGYGLSNGYVSVRVTGGTPNDNGSYNFEWRKDSPSGALISTNIITDAVNNPFTIKLDQVTAGKYYLTVKDKNYAGASSELGSCGILFQEYEVTQPDSLIATIKVKEIISCHINNDYQYKLDLDNNSIPDEAETGELTVVVTGGVGSYSYQWQILTGGSFQDIPGATSSILAKLQEGTYKVLLKDANDNEADDKKIFNYPEVLKISLSANTILCNDLQEGIVSVTATGGTAPYTYTWNTSDTTPSVTGLGAGNYFVVVQDANGCMVSGSVRIEQPGALEIEDILAQDPICNEASNGEIQIKASGGKTPYSITWSNGQTGENLSGLKAGAYTVTFTDANGCSMTKSYNLIDPEALIIDLGKDITLCQGDSMVYNIDINDPGATYRWTDQEGNLVGTAPVISLSAAGTYTAQVIDSKGCTATDQIAIKNSMEVLSPEFMITTHAYTDYTVQLVNTSPTEPEKVEWILPESDYITVVSESDEHIELQFSQTGSYKIGLKGIQGLCEKTLYKDILIEENIYGVEEPASVSSNIKDFLIIPNPNDGNYKVIVKLYKEAGIKFRIVNMSGNEPYRATTYPKSVEFEVPFQQTLYSGVYLIILETGSEVQVKRMLVNH
ncbi:hypothetical protein FACS1894169_04730 [Bacteroidia bacterium]|nr:hypothetical protein FACS1894169_04730 [Bacteroidia bacterium]